MGRCTLCPRRCGAERGEFSGAGFCGTGTLPVIARTGRHYWEEPCISGTRGSGTVFFSGCTLRCRFCQNYQISAEHFGKTVSVKRLREIYRELISLGVHNINLVSPSHFAPAVAESLETPLPVPVVVNCGGYESAEILDLFRGKVQVFLPDLKYTASGPAARYSGAPDYPEIAKAAILEMFRQVGPVILDRDGIIQRGVVIRHLILPGQAEAALDVIDWVQEAFPKGSVLLSLMAQYTPLSWASEFPELCRTVSPEEYRRVEEYLLFSGVEDGYFQEPTAANTRYIPDFHLQGVEKMQRYELNISEGTSNMTDILDVRMKVFVEEQGFTDGPDEIDERSIQAVVYDGNRPAASGRAFTDENGNWHIGRVAVHQEYRKDGVGRLLMNGLEDQIRGRHGTKAAVSAQKRAVGFYGKLGYTAVGDWYPDEGYPHITMIKNL